MSSTNTRIKDNNPPEAEAGQQAEDWNKISFILRVLLPVAGIIIFLKEKHIFSRLLLQLDRHCVSVFCPSFSQREKLLKWAGGRLPETWSSHCRTLSGGVADLWSDGSLLCTLINSAIPGACPNPHRHWRKPPLHAQAVAYKYLGVIPIFTESDLNGSLCVTLERNFLRYLNELQQAITRQSEKNEVPKSISMHYVARGMGLYSGEQHRKTVFYIYPNKNTTEPDSNIIVHIRGPYATYGRAIIPNFHNELFTTPEVRVTSDSLTTKKLLNGAVMKPKNSFIKNLSLPFMQYHKKHTGDNIIIDVAMEDDRAKVTYIPKNYGMYELIMISNGEMLRGCPFNVHILNNTTGIEDSFEAESKVDDVPSLRKRKVISKTIDFIDEQIAMAEVLKRYKRRDSVDHGPVIGSTKDDNSGLDQATDKITTEPPEEVIETTETSSKPKEEIEQICLLKYNDKTNFNTKENTIVKKDDSISEKQNSESTTETDGEKEHASDEEKHNPVSHTTYNSNQSTNNKIKRKVVNDVPLVFQLKPITESINGDKKADVLERKKQVINDARNVNNNSIIADPGPRKPEVNRIEIPEKFRRIQSASSKNFDNGLDIKHFKNAINNSNKREIPKRISTEFQDDEDDVSKKINFFEVYSSNETTYNFRSDDNNNITNINQDEVKQHGARLYGRNSTAPLALAKVPERFLQSRVLPQTDPKHAVNSPTGTSPICPDHIVPEVDQEYVKMSVAEKRKIFANKISERISSSTNSSFSEIENPEGSPKRTCFRQFEGLSVLNYLGSLKKSESGNRQTYSLCSTMSLPNISSMEDGTFQNSVKERRNFWEMISASSSTLSINSERKSGKEIDSRCRLIWSKSNGTATSDTSVSTLEDNSDFKKSFEISRSADDILSITKITSRDASKKYKSVDHSLNTCTAVSIEERKKMLLKQEYEKEKSKKQVMKPLRIKTVLRNNSKNVLNSDQGIVKEDRNDDDLVFSSITDRIKKYDSACNLSTKPRTEEKSTPSDTKNTNNKTTEEFFKDNSEEASENMKNEILTVRSHFKRTIKYFKNLEEKSLSRSNNNLSIKDCMNPLDVAHNKYYKRGGSLNLAKVNQRFSVGSIYEDVFGGKRGTFRGAANRSALVEALATFSRRENHSFKGDEDAIMYELFQKKTETKKRRSIRSIFDVYY